MFRKILLGFVASLSLLSPLAIPAETQAREPQAREFHGRHVTFRVYSRACNREAWHFSGAYGCRADAINAAHCLHDRGFETLVR